MIVKSIAFTACTSDCYSSIHMSIIIVRTHVDCKKSGIMHAIEKWQPTMAPNKHKSLAIATIHNQYSIEVIAACHAFVATIHNTIVHIPSSNVCISWSVPPYSAIFWLCNRSKPWHLLHACIVIILFIPCISFERSGLIC